jgi:methionyl-tRNA formyltransferase
VLEPDITKPEDLSLIDLWKPDWVFFLDWSWIIPSKIIKNYKCVCFHEADLPNFRGGSPIQNQIIRGITKTKLTAFLMDEGLDTGDILLQEDLSLEGHISDIMERVVKLTPVMIKKILNGDYTRTKQEEGTTYKRLTPLQSQLNMLSIGLLPLKYLYNLIRMLEDPYPNAYIKTGMRKLTFKSAEMEENKIKALVEIT